MNKQWERWDEMLEALDGKINMGAMNCMRAGYVTSIYENGELVLVCDDDITAGLLKSEPTNTRLHDTAAKIIGEPLKVIILEPVEKDDEVLQKPRDFDIEFIEPRLCPLMNCECNPKCAWYCEYEYAVGCSLTIIAGMHDELIGVHEIMRRVNWDKL